MTMPNPNLCPLRDFPASVLGHVWPVERLMIGMKASRWLREALDTHADAVSIIARPDSDQDSGRFSTFKHIEADLIRYLKGKRVSLKVEGVTNAELQTILSALVTVLGGAARIEERPSAELAHSLVELHLLKLPQCNKLLEFFDTLRNCKAVERLSLCHATICSEGRAHLLDAIANCTSLTQLNLSDVYLGYEGMERLAALLKDRTCMTNLVLRHNRSGPGSLKLLADALSHCKQLSHFELAFSALEGWEGEAEHLGLALQQCEHLTYLDLSHFRLWDRPTQELFKGLKKPKALQHLLLRWNDFIHSGLRSALTSAPISLLTLDVTGTDIGDPGATALGDSLHKLPNLRTLKLARCSFRERAADCLVPELRHCPDLTELDLAWNRLGRQGAEALASTLGALPLLADLKLCGNTIEAGVVAVAAALPSCPLLVRLDLRSCRVGDEEAQVLAGQIALLERAVHVDLRWNRFTFTHWSKKLPVGHGDGSAYPNGGKSVLRLH